MNFYRHYWKERLKISKLVKYKSEMSEVSEDMALQSREILQTFVSRWGNNLSCPGVRMHILVSFQHHDITLKLGNFIDFKAFFLAVSLLAGLR